MIVSKVTDHIASNAISLCLTVHLLSAFLVTDCQTDWPDEHLGSKMHQRKFYQFMYPTKRECIWLCWRRGDKIFSAIPAPPLCPSIEAAARAE
jgi:hypothetical protein